MKFLPLSARDRTTMLASIGLAEQELHQHVRMDSPSIFDARTEPEIMADLEPLAVPIREPLSGFGIGNYFIPSVVNTIASRGEFVTAYTPYQPECAQGTLTTIFEFQSRICRLTGMDVSNAGLYDGSTAVVEAVLMAMAETARTEVAVARSVCPAYREVLATHLLGRGAKIVEIPFDMTTGRIQPIEKYVNENTLGVVIQSPNVFGVVEREISDAFAAAKNSGAIPIQIFHPLGVTILPTPAEVGAEIAVAEGQPLGIPLCGGGPFLGLIAASSRFMRRLPGRIVGHTRDVEGRDAFVLTLQTREQHIRRERATSNICTNQALMTLRATVYIGTMGMDGMRAEALRLRNKADRASKGKRIFSGEIFNEYVSREKNGIPLEYPELINATLHAVTQ
ncbi:MAG: aminomethyl-transferring glycine dehydrogenase subunit GcvPA [Candidatus Hydrogenedentota bacterium]